MGEAGQAPDPGAERYPAASGIAGRAAAARLRQGRPAAAIADTARRAAPDRPALPCAAGSPAGAARRVACGLPATLQDPEFLAEATKMQLAINPVTGREMEAVIAEIGAMRPRSFKP